jgi:hypothetical protein
MRALICGGRDYTDRRRIHEALDDIHAASPISCVIHGDALGADRLAAEWAEIHGIPTDPHPADWDNLDAPGAIIRLNPKTGRFYNKAAGAQRNRKMVELKPDLVIAFPGNVGTNGPNGCPALALRVGIAVMTVDG